MVTKTVLNVSDLADLFSAVWEYNRRGPVAKVRFLCTGQEVQVDSVEVSWQDKGLAIRTAPEMSVEDLARQLNPPIAPNGGLRGDPKKVLPAADMRDLAAATEGIR